MDSTLVDGKSASPDRSDKEYLGFINHDCQALFQFNNPRNLSQLTLSFLEDVERGVFAPQSVEVWGGEDKNKLTKLASSVSVLPQEVRPATKNIIKINFPAQSVRFVRLTAKNVKTLPAWHPDQKTTKPSIFIDEVSLE